MDELTDLLKSSLSLQEEKPKSRENVISKQYMNCDVINERIKEELCSDTIKALSDAELLEKYKESSSLQKNISKLNEVLEKNSIEESQRKQILDNYTLQLIPPGLKGVVRGNKFNHIVKKHILSLQLDKSIFLIDFEKHCDESEYKTAEIPDWYIYKKDTKQFMIGMNQLDLWRGGQQINRGSKYITNFKENSDTLRLVCVIANELVLKSEKNKAFKLFQEGYEKNTLCYLKNLKRIIESFFNL